MTGVHDPFEWKDEPFPLAKGAPSHGTLESRAGGYSWGGGGESLEEEEEEEEEEFIQHRTRAGRDSQRGR